MAKVILATAVGALLAVGSVAALAEEKNLLDIEPLSSDELFAEKGENLGGGAQAGTDDPLRRRSVAVGAAAASGGQGNTTLIGSRSSGQTNSTSLSATNDLVSIRNIAGNAGNGG
jgi:hypothetical protein